jgi:cytochrome c oxidase subunit 3
MSEQEKYVPPEVPHYFKNHKQWDAINQLGMWLFLGTEVLFFGGLFVGFILLKGRFPESFEAGHNQLSVFYGGLNTIVLLASSLTVALAIQASDSNNKDRIVKLLWATMGLAAVFLVIKTIEYTGKYNHCLLPGNFFGFAELDAAGKAMLDNDGVRIFADHCKEAVAGHQAASDMPAHANVFFSLYFIMTGIHGLHVVIGMGLFLWVIKNVKAGRFGPNYKGSLENVGLYWHLVDLIWIFLFPTLYRVG